MRVFVTVYITFQSGLPLWQQPGIKSVRRAAATSKHTLHKLQYNRYLHILCAGWKLNNCVTSPNRAPAGTGALREKLLGFVMSDKVATVWNVNHNLIHNHYWPWITLAMHARRSAGSALYFFSNNAIIPTSKYISPSYTSRRFKIPCSLKINCYPKLKYESQPHSTRSLKSLF